MKKLFYLAFTLISVLLFSQTGKLDIKITFADGSMQNSKAKVITNLFDKTLVDPRSFTRNKIIVYSEGDKKVKISTDKIQKVDYTDLKGKEVHLAKMPDNKTLAELKYDGGVKWYRYFGTNMYDQSLIDQDYLYLGEKSYFFSILKNNKTRLKEFFKDRPDLFPLIDKINYNRFNEEDLYAILKMYDGHDVQN